MVDILCAQTIFVNYLKGTRETNDNWDISFGFENSMSM